MTVDGAHLEIDTRRDGDHLLVTATGDVDAATAGALDEVPGEASDGVAVIELLLADVTFIDSSGLRALLQLRERATAIDARVVITSASPLVERLLDVTGLREAFPPGA